MSARLKSAMFSRLFSSSTPHASIPSHISKLPMELLIQVASHLKTLDLLSLALTSKRFSDAAQEVLYQGVNLQPHPEETKGALVETRISRFLSTICSKPHLARKVHVLAWWPDSKVKLLRMHPALGILGFNVSQHVLAVAMKEYDTADILLRRLPQLKHLSLSINDKHRFVNDPNCKKTWHIPICSKVHLRTDHLSSIAGLSTLTSLHIAQRQLDWPVLTLPTLRTLSLGPSAVIQRPPAPSATAPNITALRITVQVCHHSGS